MRSGPGAGVRVGAVGRGPDTLASGELPGMRRPFPQPLRVVGPGARQAIKGVGNPVLCLRDGGGRGRYLLAEIDRRGNSLSQVLVVDPYGPRATPFRGCYAGIHVP